MSLLPRCVLAVTIVAACLATAAAKEADGLIASPEPDWPQWRGARRDGICDEKGLRQSWPEGGPKLLWKAGEMGRGWSSPIIVGGMLYITGDLGDELNIFAHDLDGKRKWKVVNGRAWKGSYKGARACCAFSQGRLYHMNAHGRVVCLDAKTGKAIWTVNVLERFAGRNIRWALAECLLIDGPRVIVSPGGKKALMAALDKVTGKTVWVTPGIPGEQAGYSSPILFRYAGRRHLVSCSSRHAFGVDADTGKLLWKRPKETRWQANCATPIYHNGHVFFASPDSLTGEVYQDEDGKPLRKGGELYRLKPTKDGCDVERVWSSKLDNLNGCSVLVDGMLYSSGHRVNKYAVCVDMATGKVRYKKADLICGSMIYADGRLYYLSERGVMALLKPTADGFEVKGQFRLVQRSRNDVWPHPVILAGRLYLRYHETLYCYDIRAKQ